VCSNSLAKVISKLYYPKIGIKSSIIGLDQSDLNYIVPAPGVCYWDLLYHCGIEDCPFKHFKNQDDI